MSSGFHRCVRGAESPGNESVLVGEKLEAGAAGVNVSPASMQAVPQELPSDALRGFLSHVQFRLSAPPTPDDFDPRLAPDDLRDSISNAAIACEEGSEIPVPELDSLVEESVSALTLFRLGERESLNEYWLSRRRAPLGDDCLIFAPDTWELCSRTLRNAPLSSNRVVVRPTCIAGHEMPIGFTLPVSSGEIPVARRPLTDGQPTIYEVVVPVEPLDARGNPFRAYLGMRFTFDPHAADTPPDEDSFSPAWVITGVAIYNRPARIGVVLPVF